MIVIENAINPHLLRAAWATWPDASWRGWHRYSGRDAEKYGTKSHHDITAAANACLMQMVSAVREHVIDEAFPDLDLHGAGMHMIPTDGHLAKHLDSSVMASTGWKREYSCVLGVNPIWEADWGGEFVMNGEAVAARFNQLILFRTTEGSFHEVRRVQGPESRCTLAIFFWSRAAVGSNPRTQAQFFHD